MHRRLASPGTPCWAALLEPDCGQRGRGSFHQAALVHPTKEHKTPFLPLPSPRGGDIFPTNPDNDGTMTAGFGGKHKGGQIKPGAQYVRQNQAAPQRSSAPGISPVPKLRHEQGHKDPSSLVGLWQSQRGDPSPPAPHNHNSSDRERAVFQIQAVATPL